MSRISSTRSQTDSELRASIQYDGEINIGWSETTTMYCSLNVAAFPFDEQTCYMTISSWHYPVEDMPITPFARVDVYNENTGKLFSNSNIDSCV
jgi:hypothetical protein